ncbi:DJ-1/PfpI family protein [Zavarzinella formosa]|uniref:DJ-1/PfpI family protein n=1 Tax=Zavarzinella formosa TaxID=360055 RepID=UPI0002F25107|nr:DJ-1/PfpI family protein [Zavarzinella formosa]
MSKGNVLLIIGDAAEVLDTFYPLHRLQEEGYTVHVAGPAKRVYHLVQHDRHPEWDITIESPGYKLAADIAFKDADPAKYVGMVISGGRAPEYIRYDADLLKLTRAMFEANKPVASVCHGIEIVAAAGVLKGLTATTVAKCQLDVESFGGHYENAEVVVSRNLVTARTWHDNPAWMRAYVKMLNDSVSK